MGSLVVWNGSAYAPISNMQVWDASTSSFITPTSIQTWANGAFVKLWPPNTSVVQVITSGPTSVSPPSWWRFGIDYMDVMNLAGGGGSAWYNNAYGNGGSGVWYTFTSEYIQDYGYDSYSGSGGTPFPLTVTPGTGGAGAQSSSGGGGGTVGIITEAVTGSHYSYSTMSEIYTFNGEAISNGGPSAFGTSSSYVNNAPSMTYEGVTINPSPYTDGNYYGQGAAGVGWFQNGTNGTNGMIVLQFRQNQLQ